MVEVYYDCPDGWLDLVVDTLAKLFALGEDFKIYQIKEKFGGLRIYLGASSDEAYEITNAAEERSYHICQDCGVTDDNVSDEQRVADELMEDPWISTEGSWVRTLCRVCRKKRDAGLHI